MPQCQNKFTEKIIFHQTNNENLNTKIVISPFHEELENYEIVLLLKMSLKNLIATTKKGKFFWLIKKYKIREKKENEKKRRLVNNKFQIMSKNVS